MTPSGNPGGKVPFREPITLAARRATAPSDTIGRGEKPMDPAWIHPFIAPLMVGVPAAIASH